ncbi:MAG: hypothetical protein ACMVY4_04450 [Minwuia sp.]|uniref:hypothetical protein n=1 Tax=Minwuia sp. TaxID=2493630 RepID=UPI003A8AD934
MSRLRTGILILSVALLAGCAQQEAGPAGEPEPVVSRPAQAAAAAPADVDAPPPPPSRPAGPAPAQRRTLKQQADRTAAADAKTPVAFSSLVGMTETELRRELGAPDSIGDQPPARVWRYGISGCDLKLFIFQDVSSGEAKALAFEAEPAAPAAGAKTDPRCAETGGKLSG